MIIDQEEFKLKRNAALQSGDIAKIRLYCKSYAPHLLRLSDEELLKLASNAPNWE